MHCTVKNTHTHTRNAYCICVSSYLPLKLNDNFAIVTPGTVVTVRGETIKVETTILRCCKMFDFLATLGK